MIFALKADLPEPPPPRLSPPTVKTMNDGDTAQAGDGVCLFANETSGGRGLLARGSVAAAEATPRRPGPERQTPRLDLVIQVAARARRPLGRAELKAFRSWDDGRPESALDFKFHHHARDKLVGLSDATAAFLDGFFGDAARWRP